MIALRYSEYGPPEVLALAAVEEPQAGPGRLRIRVRAAGVTPADWYLRSGSLQEMIPLRLPHVPGVDAAGVVDQIGDGVTGVEVGDAVFGLTPISALGGAFAELAVLEAWASKPAALSWEQAGGAAANVETATRVLDELGVGAGTRLLIEGAAGGVGTVCVQLAAARGATVIGTATEPNHDLLRDLGAAPTTYGPGLDRRIAELGHQVIDVVLDAAGSGSLHALVEIVGEPGRVVTIADVNAEAHGVRLSRSAGPDAGSTDGAAGLAIASSLAADGRFTVPIDSVHALADGARAHERSESRRARGKVVVTMP